MCVNTRYVLRFFELNLVAIWYKDAETDLANSRPILDSCAIYT